MTTQAPVEDDASLPTEQRAERPLPWYLRVVPVCVAVALVLGVLALVAPPVRDELRQSLSREHEQFVEAYFPRTQEGAGQVVCAYSAGQAHVGFEVLSRLEQAKSVDYIVVVTPTGKAAAEHPASEQKGSIATRPGKAVGALVNADVPRGSDYTVTVRLPSVSQELRATCPATDRA